MNRQFPCMWPEGWHRTRPQDQKKNAQWKKTREQFVEQLEAELKKMGVTNMVLTANISPAAQSIEPRDPAVAVYFSLPKKQDYSWQQGLGITNPYPTEAEIQDAYRRLAAKYHPDAPGGDAELFHALIAHKENAIRFIRQMEGKLHDQVVACDSFNEVRLNVKAIQLTIAALRQIERCGTSTLLERAFSGFKAALPQAATGA